MDMIEMVLMMVFPTIFFMVGKWQDVFFRTRTKRNLMKENLIVLAVLNKARNVSRYYSVNPKHGFIKHKQFLWFLRDNEIIQAVIDKSKCEFIDLKKVENYKLTKDGKIVVQEGKGIGKRTFILPKDAIIEEKEKGFKITEDLLQWHEGVPLVFVDEDHITPVHFEGMPESVKPEDLQAVNDEYVRIEKEKEKPDKKGIDLIQIIIILGIVGAIVLSFLAWSNSAKTLEIVTAIQASGVAAVAVQNNSPIPQGATVQGDRIVVNGNG